MLPLFLELVLFGRVKSANMTKTRDFKINKYLIVHYSKRIINIIRYNALTGFFKIFISYNISKTLVLTHKIKKQYVIPRFFKYFKFFDSFKDFMFYTDIIWRYLQVVKINILNLEASVCVRYSDVSRMLEKLIKNLAKDN